MKKSNLISSVAVGALLISLASVALPTTAMAQEAEVEPDDVITVTLGSRRDSRSAADTIAPIDVISTNELLNQGDTDIQNILRTSVPSYNVNTQPISDAATLIRPANLRGLAPDSTLVLVNGKRRHRAAVISFLGGGIADGSQGPDISVIPTIALQQVEVLRDGAASQYGSDAIAGVINFALKDAAEGGSFEVEYGTTYEGDGEQWSVSGNIGLPIDIAQGGFLNASFEYGEIGGTIRSVQRDDAAALIAAGNADVGSIRVNTVTDKYAQYWGQPQVTDDLSVFFNSGIDITPEFEIYAFGNYSQREAEGGFFFRNPTNRGGVYAGPLVDPLTGFVDANGVPSVLVGDLSVDTAGDCPAGIPLTAGGGLLPDPTILAQVAGNANCFSFIETIPGGFTPRFGGELVDESIVAGFRGEMPIGSGLGFDVSFTYGSNEADFLIKNTINASLGPNTPRDFDPGAYIQTDTNANVDFTYAVANDFFASDINFAFGYEHREEEFEIVAGELASYQIGPLAAPSVAFPGGQGFSSSSNGFGGFTPSSAGKNSQSNHAYYIDAEVDATEALIVQVAVRHEDFYDSFGSTTNYKIGGLYRVSDDITVRSTWSTGFHAPTAGQANVTNITTAFANGILRDQGTIPLSSAAGQFIADRLEASTGVRPTLSPEESENFTLGVAFSVADIGITVDFFNIDVEDRIAISDQQDFLAELIAVAGENSVALPANVTTSQALNLLDAAGVLDASDFSGSEDLASFGFFTNSFDTRTRGIDIVANRDVELYDGSNTSLAFAFNWTDTEVTDRGLNSAAPLSLGRQRQLEDNLPAVRANFTANHFHGDWRGLARVNYFGEFFECHLDSVSNDPATGGCDLPIEADAQITLDAEIAYSLSNGVELVAGAQNIFDSYPDENPFAGVVGSLYPATAPGGYSGGLYYVKVRGNF